MAEVRIVGIKDLVTTPVLAAGIGGTVALVGGDALGGVISGMIPIPDTDVGKRTAVKVISKIALGGVGAFLGGQPGAIGSFGVGMAIGGIGGALADAISYGIEQAGRTSTGVVTPAERLGYRLIRRVPLLPPALPTPIVRPIVTSKGQEVERVYVPVPRRIAGLI
ncbi:MAG: hypothetical protein AB1420_15785 [Bacillota bacterium]